MDEGIKRGAMSESAGTRGGAEGSRRGIKGAMMIAGLAAFWY
jgi:hypothetical protein